MNQESTSRILVVDDDDGVRTVVSWQLEADGFVVTQAEDGASAVAAIRDDRPDLVVLDLSMPGMGGLDVLRWVRQDEEKSRGVLTPLPIIILSGRGGETDRVMGLDLGADDYLVKPFSPAELSARVRSLRRRSRSAGPAAEDPPGLVVNSASREVTMDGHRVELTAREFDLLAFLVAHPRQVFNRAQLLRHVWQSDTGWQVEATVTEHVHRLRNKLEVDPAHPHWLRTVRGVGYQLGVG